MKTKFRRVQANRKRFSNTEVAQRACLVPRRLSRCARKGRREGDNGCRLYPSHGPLRCITSHSFRARLCHAKNEAPEEEAVSAPRSNSKFCGAERREGEFCFSEQFWGNKKIETQHFLVRRDMNKINDR